MEASHTLEDLKSAGMKLGEQSVINLGVSLMLEFLVDSLDMQLLVCTIKKSCESSIVTTTVMTQEHLHTMLSMVKEQALYFWMT